METNTQSRLPARTRTLLGLFLGSAMAFVITVPLVRTSNAPKQAPTALFLRDVIPEHARQDTERTVIREKQTLKSRLQSGFAVLEDMPSVAFSFPGKTLLRLSALQRRRARAPVEMVGDAVRTDDATLRFAAPVLVEQAQFVLDTTAPVFPAFGVAAFPVTRIPNWGAMRSSIEWDRRYEDMLPSDFVPVPAYDLEHLKQPMHMLSKDLQEVNIPIVTEKLFYATRFFGRYNSDSGEYEGDHPGIDLKLAPGTPVGAIAGGRVNYAGTDPYLGNYVMIEHQLPDSGAHAVSIYGHLESVSMQEGQDVKTGDFVGRVGSTGRSSGPHLHLQVDYKKEPGRHQPYIPGPLLSKAEVSQWTLSPISFIAKYRSGR